MTDEQLEQIGRICRAAYQSVGVSNGEPWDSISEYRRDRHRRAGEAIVAGLIAAGIVAAADRLAALEEYVAANREYEAAWVEFGVDVPGRVVDRYMDAQAALGLGDWSERDAPLSANAEVTR